MSKIVQRSQRLLMSKVLFLTCASVKITSRWVFESLKPSLTRVGYHFSILNIKDDSKNRILSAVGVLSEDDLVIADIRDHHLSARLMDAISLSPCTKLNLLIDPDLTFELSNKKAYFLFDKTLVSFLSTYNKFKEQFPKLVYFPYCAYVSDETCIENFAKKPSVVFIGSPTEMRLRYLSLLKYWKIPYVSNLDVRDPRNCNIPWLSYSFRHRFDLYIFIRASNLLSKLFPRKTSYTAKTLTDEEYASSYEEHLVALSVLEHGLTGMIFPIAYHHIRMRDLEAIAANCILVTRETLDINFLRSQGIYLLTYSNKDSLKRALHHALQLSNSNQLIRNNRAILREEFDWGEKFQRLHYKIKKHRALSK